MQPPLLWLAWLGIGIYVCFADPALQDPTPALIVIWIAYLITTLYKPPAMWADPTFKNIRNENGEHV